MDTFSRLGLIFLVLFAGVISSRVAHAQQFPTYSQAMAACQSNNYNPSYWGVCRISPPGCEAPSGGVAGYVGVYNVNSGPVCISFGGSLPPPDDSQCSHSDEGDDSPTQTWVAGKIGNGWSSCESQQVPSGQWVLCGHKVDPNSPPYYDPNVGQWRTLVTYSATHQLCGASASSNPQSTSWKDGAGNAVPSANAPPDPPKPLPTTPAPKSCGGGSCYDPNTDQYCAVAGGDQICVPGNTARSTGGCYSDASSTLCAGSPPPAPPPPPASPITDPPSQIQASDNTTQSNPTTGANVNVTTNVYTLPGVSVSNGAKPGDSQPASSSTAPTTPGQGSLSGGGDCNTPPVCSGDRVMCGTARMQWAQFCRLHKDVGSDQPAPSLSSLSPASAGSVWTSSTSTGDATADAALQGNFDASGFGYSSDCPMKDLTVDIAGHSFSVPFSEGCVIGPWLRAIVLAMATFWAAMIVAKGS